MGFNCGIVGLPNVGKSTLFNALTRTAAAAAANYPFCTVEPNIGRVAVPDARLDTIAGIEGSAKIIPTTLEFVDIAGLVKGASKGEGLGNQFLGNIRQVDAILHVLRCFEDPNITHVEGSIDPLRDADVVDTELMLSDLDSLEKRAQNFQKKAEMKDKDALQMMEVMQPALDALRQGHPVRTVTYTPEQRRILDTLHLLTDKPVLYVCNVEESSARDGNALSARVVAHAKANGAQAVIISAQIESEIAQLTSDGERAEYLASLNLDEPGLNRVIRAGYALLDLVTYFTCGPKEARAWTIRRGTAAPQAAGVIHSDFEKGFIRAETCSYADFLKFNGETGCRNNGALRQEGKEYIVQDGDILHFKFNV